MITLLALPQPGPPLADSFAMAWSWKMDPRLRPSTPQPPTRSRSRRVILRFGLHRSVQSSSGILSIIQPVFASVQGCRVMGGKSMIEEEGRIVDERPREVLRAREALVGKLFLAGG